MGLEHHLEIFIVTYNREKFLKQTLGFLVGSAVKDCKLTILDNCSTDNTASLYEAN
jgi:GT2 family glycosyltransferase